MKMKFEAIFFKQNYHGGGGGGLACYTRFVVFFPYFLLQL